MRSDIYKYQENYRAKYIVQILIFLLAIALLIISVVYIAVNQKADYNTFKILIFVIIFGCIYLHPFGKYKNRYHLNLVFDDGKIAVLKKNRATAVKIDKSQEIWVLPTSQFRYVQYMPYMSIEKGSLVIIGNQASFEDERVVKLTNGYNDYLRHLNEPFGRGYISIIYREPLRDWLNLYNKQIYRDRFPVASYKCLTQHNKLSKIRMHH